MSLEPQHRRIVMIVEDDATLSAMAFDLVAECGFEPFTADTGQAAHTYLEGHAEDVAALFLDVGLRDSIDGIALAITTNAAYPWIRICVASGQMAKRPDELPPGIKFLSKPWRPVEVMAFVSEGRSKAT